MAKASICLLLASAVVSLIGCSLFLHMAVEVNKRLPPDKRIPLIELRNQLSRIRRLHEDAFPESSLSTILLILMVTAGLAWVAAIGNELIRTSK